MQVTIYSRKNIEDIIARWKFPDNTAVISFYDPDVKQIDEDYTRVDYSNLSAVHLNRSILSHMPPYGVLPCCSAAEKW